MHPLQDLVSLATEQPVAVRYFEVWNSTEEHPYRLQVGRQWSYAPETYPSALPLFTAASLRPPVVAAPGKIKAAARFGR
jgi:hypothetical protein